MTYTQDQTLQMTLAILFVAFLILFGFFLHLKQRSETKREGALVGHAQPDAYWSAVQCPHCLAWQTPDSKGRVQVGAQRLSVDQWQTLCPYNPINQTKRGAI